MRKLATAFAAAVLTAAVYLPASANAKSIVDVAKEAGTFETLLAAATAAGFADERDEVNNLTVLAPTDGRKAKIFVGGVKVEAANIKASNGYIHVIGEVLLPDRACP